jgi:hypothetical protein
MKKLDEKIIKATSLEFFNFAMNEFELDKPYNKNDMFQKFVNVYKGINNYNEFKKYLYKWQELHKGLILRFNDIVFSKQEKEFLGKDYFNKFYFTTRKDLPEVTSIDPDGTRYFFNKKGKLLFSEKDN